MACVQDKGNKKKSICSTIISCHGYSLKALYQPNNYTTRAEFEQVKTSQNHIIGYIIAAMRKIRAHYHLIRNDKVNLEENP